MICLHGFPEVQTAFTSASVLAKPMVGFARLFHPTYPGFPVELGGVVEQHAAFLKVVHRRVADPRDMKRAFPVLGRKCNKSPGAPSFALFCEGWDTTNLDTDRRVSHPLLRAQRMGHPPFVA